MYSATVELGEMVFPSKTDRASIVAAAKGQLEQSGLRNLSLRAVAADLHLAPNALYRYFTDRSELEGALSAEAARAQLALLREAAGGRGPAAAIRAMAEAYLRFAREQPALYEVLMARCRLAEADTEPHRELWAFVVSQVARITGKAGGDARTREAAVALWAFLFGIAGLQAAEVFSEEKPLSSFRFGLNAWLAAASARRHAATTVSSSGKTKAFSEMV